MELPYTRVPEVGDQVLCPAGRGESPHSAIIRHVGLKVQVNPGGTRYVWCTVCRVDGRPGEVWPSHHLGYTLPD